MPFMIDEIWKEIPGHSNYAASNLGRIKRITRGQHTKPGYILSPPKNYRYARVLIYKDGKRKYICVHTLVAKAFLGEISFGYQVNHKDCNGHNNCVENLEYVTPQENVRHAHQNGRYRKWTKKMKIAQSKLVRGEKNVHAKLTEENVKEIRKIYKENKTWHQRYGLAKKLAKRFGVHRAQIFYIRNGKTWNHVS